MDGWTRGGRTSGGRPRACVADLRRGATATARYTLSMKISFRRVDRTNYFRSEFGAIGRPTDGRTGREVVTSKRLLWRRCRWRHNGLVIFRPFRGRFDAAAIVRHCIVQSILPPSLNSPSIGPKYVCGAASDSSPLSLCRWTDNEVGMAAVSLSPEDMRGRWKFAPSIGAEL